MSGIMMADLARMARAATQQLPARGTHDPSVLADYEFLVKNGINRADFAERERHRARDDFETSATFDLGGKPPGVATLTAMPKRSRWDRYVEWRASEKLKLTDLETTRAELLGLKAAPAATESKIQAAIRRTADYLMGKSQDGGDELDRKGLDDRLAIEKHRSQAADLLLPDLDRQIEVATLRVKRLQERESEFLRPVLVEHAEQQYVAKYLAAIEALRKAAAPLAGLTTYLYGHGMNERLPDFGLDSLEEASTRIVVRDAAMWDELAEGLGATPRPKGWNHDDD
jgi:hypothetical protein